MRAMGNDLRRKERGQERKRTVIIIIVRLIAVVCSGVRAGPENDKSNQKIKGVSLTLLLEQTESDRRTTSSGYQGNWEQS